MANIYLVLYNLVSAAAWLYIFIQVAQSFAANKTPEALYGEIAQPLMIIQTSMTLEIFHSLFGLVRSPVMTNVIQVGSRLVVLWIYLIPSVPSQNHWSLYLLIGSWSFVEIFRYAYYLFALFLSVDKIPYPLFFLRYSLFMVLYPTGITGEIFAILNSLPRLEDENPLLYRVTLIILSLYVLGGPYMILNMWGQRKRASKSRQDASLPPRKESGLVWPVTDPKTQERASTKTNKKIFADSVRRAAPELAAAVDRERDWRFGYGRHILANVRKCLEHPKIALEIAQDGLNSAQNTFQIVRDGETMSIAEAMKRFKGSYKTAHIKGTLPKPNSQKIEVPYGGSRRQSDGTPRPYYTYRDDETVLSGDALRKQLDTWVSYGTIEKSAADAIRACMDHNEWLDLSEYTFILLGATSAMGPLEFLLRHGAHIVAVDLNRKPIWERLINRVKNSCGSMTFPYKSEKDLAADGPEIADVAGANLLADPPEIANWLTSLKYTDNVTIGNYTYLDGALHVQLSVACDAIIERVCEYHPKTAVAFLCTPTDIHVIPKEAWEAMGENARKVPFWQTLFNMITFGKCLVKNQMRSIISQNKEEFFLVDGIVTAQGPNYALAKRLQHWRAVVARSNGHTVCSNVAPSTATKSVVHNAQFAAAYGGFHLFKPLEVMYQETSNAVMGILLLHDIRNPSSPASGKFPLSNPYDLFKYGAFHGGVSRCAFKVDSIGEAAVISYYLGQYKFPTLAVLVALASVGHWVVTGIVSPF